MKNKWIATAAEIALIVVVSATAGIAWNRTLLASAWRGEVTQQPATAQPAAPSAAEAIPMPIAMAQVKELLDAKQAVVVDARSAANFSQGHIAGSLSLPLDVARKNPQAALKGKVAKDATIIAYCNGFSCHDSMELGRILMRAGYASVYVFEGGFPEWRDAGYAVAAGAI